MNEEDQLEQSFQANEILQDPLQQPYIQAGESLEQWTLSNKNDFDEPYQIIKVLALELQVDSQQDQLSIRSQSAISNISRQTRSRQTAAQRLASREGMAGQISPRFFDSDRDSDGRQLPNRKNSISVKIEKKLGVSIYHIIESNLQQRLLKLKLSQQQYIQGLVQSTSIILASAFIFLLLALIQEKYFNSIKFYAPLASPLGFHLLQLGIVLKDISSKGKDSLIQNEKLITQRIRLAHQVIVLTKYVAVFLYIRSQTISPYLVLISLILSILSNFGLIYHIKHPQESKENMKLEENIQFL
ncbi:hypothetical protein FGO68_gene1234 [Halteria grandinella]|uniref:Transmembrane protein n=1 Tax=Halteria grandinella TaxID=5974 RepID=A0A8J8NFH3_HALGN|nr:hypothetical protein FGO68_gene1234 [Halteria grandinella]